MTSNSSGLRLVLVGLLAVLLLTHRGHAQQAGDAAAQPVTRDPNLGVCIHIGRPGWERVIPLLTTSGVTWVRTDFNWKNVETAKGVYVVPPDMLAGIERLHAAGLKILLIFNFGNPLYAPDDYNPDAYSKAAAYVAATLAGKIDAIEILNEPANFGYSKHYGGTWNGIEKDGSISPWVGKYVELINMAAKAIKAANPNVKVIGLGSVAPVNFRQLAMGIVPEVDGIVDHPYSYRTPPEIIPFASSEGILQRDGIATADERGTFASQIRMYREQSKNYDGPKEIWLTEFGWSTYQEAQGGKLYAGFTESAQAKYILRRLAEAFGLGVNVAIIYDFLEDGVNPYEPEHHFGLIDANLNPKPSYYAVRRFAAAMAPFHPQQTFELNVYAISNRPDIHPIIWDGSRLETTGTVISYQFSDNNGKSVLALWSTERADGDLNPIIADVEIVSKTPIVSVSAYNILSDQHYDLPLEKEEGRVVLKKLQIPDSPLLLSVSFESPVVPVTKLSPATLQSPPSTP